MSRDEIKTISELTRHARQIGLTVRLQGKASINHRLPDLLLLINSGPNKQRLTFASPMQDFEIEGIFKDDFVNMLQAIDDDPVMIDTLEVLDNVIPS